MELILVRNCSLLNLDDNDMESLKSLFLKKVSVININLKVTNVFTVMLWPCTWFQAKHPSIQWVFYLDSSHPFTAETSGVG